MPSDRRCLKALTLIVLLMAAVCGSAVAADVFDRPPAVPARLDAQVAWEVDLPTSATASFQYFHLLDSRVYAMASDGAVVAVRADSGEIAWIRKLAEEGDTLRPPVPYRTQTKDLVVFARLDDVVSVDAKTGVPVDFVGLAKPAVTQIAVAPGRLFVAQTNGRLAAYRLSDGYVFWRAGFNDKFLTPPVFAPAINAVIAVDEVGLLAGLRNESGTESRIIFKQNLRSDPAGDMAVDGDMLYLATENQTLHAIALAAGDDGKMGEIAWQYRLAKAPEGGPILTKSAIYQATRGGGLHRIAKQQGEFKNWYDPQAIQFLAEWPEGVVVLRSDGSLALIGNDPAHPLALGSAGGFDRGLANSRNDAVFLYNFKGQIRCIRPAKASPLTAAAFMAKDEKLPAEPDETTQIDRLRESAKKKRDKLAGRTPAPEPNIPASPAASAQAKAGNKGPQTAPAPEPYDPLRSQRPVVR